MIVANADFMGGFALWVDEQRHLHHTYSFLGVETYRQVSSEPLPTGDVTVRMLFDSHQPVAASGGRVTLWADDRLIGEGELPQTVPLAFTSYAGMDIGRDNGLVVDRGYEDKAPMRSPGPSPRSSSTSSPYIPKPPGRCTSTHRSSGGTGRRGLSARDRYLDEMPWARMLSLIVLMVCLAGCGGDQLLARHASSVATFQFGA